MKNQIALLIKGNITAGGGMQPLIAIGVFPKDVADNMDTAPKVPERLSYKIRHGNTDITYTMTDVNVRSAKSSRGGRLVIGISIPCDMRLKDGKSPYWLLKDIYRTFVELHMTTGSDGFHTFKDQDLSNEPFKTLMDSYELEVRSTKGYRRMSEFNAGETGIVSVQTEESLAELMRDSQYPEFTGYSQIEAGLSCVPTVNIRIPRPRKYRVYLNGVYKNVDLTDARDAFNSADYLLDTKYQTWDHVGFQLEELLDSLDGTLYGGRIRISKEEERIDCEVSKQDKRFEFTAEIKPALGGSPDNVGKARKALQEGKLSITLGGEDISDRFVSGDKIVVRGSNVEKLPQLSTKGYGNLEFSIEMEADRRKYCLRVKQAKASSFESIGSKPNPNRNQNNDRPAFGSAPVLEPGTPKYQLGIIAEDPMQQYEVIVKSADKRFYLRQNIRFAAEGKVYKARIAFDEAWAGAGTLEVFLQRLSPKGTLERSQPTAIFYGATPTDIHVSALTFKPVSSSPKMSVLLYAAIVVVLVLIALAAGFYVGYKRGGSNVENTNKLLAKRNTILAECNTILAEYNTKCDTYINGLKDLEKKYIDLQNTVAAAEIAKNAKQAFREQIVVNVIACNWNKVQELIKNDDNQAYATPAERTAISSFYWDGEKGKNREKAQQTKINKAIKENSSKLKTIEDIVAFYWSDAIQKSIIGKIE